MRVRLEHDRLPRGLYHMRLVRTVSLPSKPLRFGERHQAERRIKAAHQTLLQLIR